MSDEAKLVKKCVCGSCGPHIVEIKTEGVHHAAVICIQCRRHVAWMSKPDQDKAKRPAAHTDLVKRFSKGYCEMCFITKENLPKGEALEAQHVIEFQDGGSNERENIWILCTACHKLVHWRRTYVGHLLQTLAASMKRWQE